MGLAGIVPLVTAKVVVTPGVALVTVGVWVAMAVPAGKVWGVV
jgi:hypothetical protein